MRRCEGCRQWFPAAAARDRHQAGCRGPVDAAAHARRVAAARAQAGRRGGPARARALSPARRTEIARLGARARWQALSPARRTEIARQMALALWRRRRAS